MSYSNDKFFKFQSFYSKLNNHITHFQLRSLVVCGENPENGIFYPSRCYHDDNLNQLDNHDGHVPHHNFFKLCRLMTDKSNVEKRSMKLDCIQDSRSLKSYANSRISSAACSKSYLANGTFEGGVILHTILDPENVELKGEFCLTNTSEGITNCLAFSKDDTLLFIASNDLTTRILDLQKSTISYTSETPFAINALAVCPHNPALTLIVGDNTDGFIVDYRCKPGNLKANYSLIGHKDYGFCCDWSPTDENLLITGNQDGTIRLWDKRMSTQSVNCWNSALGSPSYQINRNTLGGPVRNCTFSHNGDYIVWAETLDHAGVVQVDEIKASTAEQHLRVQSIDFIGKCIGMNVCPTDGRNEKLIIGVNDQPLGGILSYSLETPSLPQFDFLF